jgi:uncharacterized protein YuzE
MRLPCGSRPRARYVESEEVAPGVVLDYDNQGRVIGIELLYGRELLATGRAGAASANRV